MHISVLAVAFLSSLVACKDKEFVCVDTIQEGDGLSDNMDDFIGVESCYYSFANDKDCEEEGGYASEMGDYGWDNTCAKLGFGFRCGGVAAVKDEAECPEEYWVTEL